MLQVSNRCTWASLWLMKTQAFAITSLWITGLGTPARGRGLPQGKRGCNLDLPGYLCAFKELHGAVSCFLAVAQGVACTCSPPLWLVGSWLLRTVSSGFGGDSSSHCLFLAGFLTNGRD